MSEKKKFDTKIIIPVTFDMRDALKARAGRLGMSKAIRQLVVQFVTGEIVLPDTKKE